MKECNPAGGWRLVGGKSPWPALSLNFPSIFMPLSFVKLSINFYSWAGPQFYHLHLISHTDSCINND